MSRRASLGVDIGGTKTALGVVDPSGNILDRMVIPTPKESAEKLVAEIATGAALMAEQHPYRGIGVAVAALTDKRHDNVPFATHLPLRNVPFTHMLSHATGHGVTIDNDATAAMWGEWKRGAARGTSDSIMVSVGTGIGGGIVSHGELQRGYNGMAGEIGHLRLVPDGRLCGCGLRGCWEQYASGRVLDRWVAEQLIEATPFAGQLIEQAGSPDAVTGKSVSDLARAGVPQAIDVVAQLGQHLGAGMASLASIVDPELFVIGGGLVELGELLFAPTRESFESHFFAAAYREWPRIVSAELGADAALIGAADLAVL